MAGEHLDFGEELYRLRQDVGQLQRDTAVLLDRWTAYAAVVSNINSLMQLSPQVSLLREDVDKAVQCRRENCPMVDRITALEKKLASTEGECRQNLIDMVELKSTVRSRGAQAGGVVGAVAGAIAIIVDKVVEYLVSRGGIP